MVIILSLSLSFHLSPSLPPSISPPLSLPLSLPLYPSLSLSLAHTHTHTHIRREQPGIDLYEFDAVLLSEYCSPSVAAGKVVMNNLTHTASKTRYVNTPSIFIVSFYVRLLNRLKVPSDGSREIAHLPISLVLSLANSLCRATRSSGLNERK